MFRVFTTTISILIFACSIVSADPGETDENEGHYDQKTGVYHYHRKITPPIEQDYILIRSQAIKQAKIDAVLDANRNGMWYGAGFFFGVFGIGAAYIMTPSIPTSRLIAKSPEYVIYYSETYKQAARDRHVEQATAGCLGAGVLLTLYYLYSSGQL